MAHFVIIKVHSRITTFVAICVLAAGPLASGAPTPPTPGVAKITAIRASNLAQTYYMRYLGGHGGLGPVVQHETYWLAPVYLGPARTPNGSIRVDSRTGTVSYSSHPTVSAKSLDSWFATVTKRGRAP